MKKEHRIESLLSARMFLRPQSVADRVYFISDLSGRMSLYSMRKGGSVPQPLLPPNIALQNPGLMKDGESFVVYPELEIVLVMIDRDGDENYQPCVVPLDGGTAELVFGDMFAEMQVMCTKADIEKGLAYFCVDPRNDPVYRFIRADIGKRTAAEIWSSKHGAQVAAVSEDEALIVLADVYTQGDHVLYLKEGSCEPTVLFGKPLEARQQGEAVPLNSIDHCHFTKGEKGLLFLTSLFDDAYGLGYLPMSDTATVRQVEIVGAVHRGMGEMEMLKAAAGHYLVQYNIDGCTWLYEGTFDELSLRMTLDRVLVGQGELSGGVLESVSHDPKAGECALAFSSATSPVQLYTITDSGLQQHTSERLLGVSEDFLSPGEDASYDSHDGTRISARLYLPPEKLGCQGPRPVVFYIHGGPQSQERPDFTWFSMPLIQCLTLNGIGVFVPNARGSTGYGLNYMKTVDRDWGGSDRWDHVAAFDVLARDERLDMKRAGVMGRSYGGFMTLTLAGRHPTLWKGACDLFGPYNLVTLLERMPKTWQTYFELSLGHPEKDREFLLERSPATHLHSLSCPLMVIQGRNDPRVVEAESRDLVERLRGQGKDVEYLLFDNEGHDIIKYENKVRCHNEIVRFFRRLLEP